LLLAEPKIRVKTSETYEDDGTRTRTVTEVTIVHGMWVSQNYKQNG